MVATVEVGTSRFSLSLLCPAVGETEPFLHRGPRRGRKRLTLQLVTKEIGFNPVGRRLTRVPAFGLVRLLVGENAGQDDRSCTILGMLGVPVLAGVAVDIQVRIIRHAEPVQTPALFTEATCAQTEACSLVESYHFVEVHHLDRIDVLIEYIGSSLNRRVVMVSAA